MTEALENIFNNIYQSEQESKAQHEYLSNLKNQILLSSKEIKAMEEKHKSITENTTKKMKQLSSHQVMLKTLNVRQNLLQERIKELRLEKETLLETRNQLKVELYSMRAQFYQETEKFVQEHGISRKKGRLTFTSGNTTVCGLMDDQRVDLPVPNHQKLTNALPEKELEFEGVEAIFFDVEFNSIPV